MKQANYKTIMKRAAIDGLAAFIETLITNFPAEDDADKMLYANLFEVMMKAKKKLLVYKTEYGFSLSPAQAMALRIMTNEYHFQPISYLGNKLHLMSHQIHQQYS